MPKYILAVPSSWNIQHGKILYHGGNIKSSQYPFFVLGANFGPYHTEEYRSAMDKVYTKLKDICFRDTYSKNLFADNDHVRQAPDILFSYPMPKVEENKKTDFYICNFL